MFKGTFLPYCDLLWYTPLQTAGRLDLSYHLVMLFPTASFLWPAMFLHSQEGLSVVSSQIAISICLEEIKYDSNYNREKQ